MFKLHADVTDKVTKLAKRRITGHYRDQCHVITTQHFVYLRLRKFQQHDVYIQFRKFQ